MWVWWRRYGVNEHERTKKERERSHFDLGPGGEQQFFFFCFFFGAGEAGLYRVLLLKIVTERGHSQENIKTEKDRKETHTHIQQTDIDRRQRQKRKRGVWNKRKYIYMRDRQRRWQTCRWDGSGAMPFWFIIFPYIFKLKRSVKLLFSTSNIQHRDR